MLKTDESLRTSLFGHLQSKDGALSESQKSAMERVSDQDRVNLGRIGVSVENRQVTFTRDPRAEARLLEPNLNLEIEYNDVLKASQFSIKFVGINTPSSLPPNMVALPRSLFFTFKFYTFQAVQT